MRKGAVSMSVPNPLSSGCEKVSAVLAARSPSPATGFDQLSLKVPPVGTRRAGPTETSAAHSWSLAASADAPKLACGR